MVTRSLIPRRDDFLFPLEQTFDKFFDDFFSSNNLDRIKGSGGYPKMDVSLTEDAFLVQVAVPGSTSEDVKVEVTPQSETVNWLHV
jgi:HSP20 family molecular chaperone IbpA